MSAIMNWSSANSSIDSYWFFENLIPVMSWFCHSVIIDFLFHYLMLNMFWMLVHPSSGACDLFVELFHGLCCSVRIEVFALAYSFSDECLFVTCVVV